MVASRKYPAMTIDGAPGERAILRVTGDPAVSPRPNGQDRRLVYRGRHFVLRVPGNARAAGSGRRLANLAVRSIGANKGERT